MPTIRTICADAAQELGVVGQGQPLTAESANVLLGLLRRLLNAWNADRRAVYATAFGQYTLVPDLTPHTIGPTGTFVVTQRPVSVDAANLLLTPDTPTVNTPIKIRDNQWWVSQSVPTLTSTFPTDLYYQPDWPNGSLYFWPVPETAYDVQLMTRVVLDDTVDFNDAFSLPPGYQQAITLTLAEMAERPFGVNVIPTLTRDASLARAAIFNNNDQIPKLRTHDAGMTPGQGGSRADFNWLTGQIV